MAIFDAAIIGGGIVGLSTAWQLTRLKPSWKVVLIEKESTLAFHQTGRNSGVIHSGIYYRPGSLRARNCREGKILLEQFCTEHQITWKRTGKVIVATHESQLPQLQTIFERGQQNGVDCRIIDRNQLLELEPHCAGIQRFMCRIRHSELSRRVSETGRTAQSVQQIFLNACVESMEQTETVRVNTSTGIVEARQVINCAGLHSDKSGSSKRLAHEGIDRSFSRRILRADSLGRPSLQNVDLSRPGSSFSISRSAFYSHGSWRSRCRSRMLFRMAREGYDWGTMNAHDLGNR